MPDTEQKQLRKTLELSSKEALKALLYLKFSITSPSESEIICELVMISNGAPLNLTNGIKRDIERLSGLKTGGINTLLWRAGNAGVFKREGKTIYLHPVFSNWESTSQILFKIVDKNDYGK